MTQSNNIKPSFQLDPCDNTITLVRGNTCPLKITPTQEIEGVKSPYILQEGDKVIFTIQTRLAGTDVFKKILTNADYDEKLNLAFKLNYEDTINLELTTYEYDIALQTASGDFYTFIPLSYFKIVKNVSELIEDASNEDEIGRASCRERV